MFSQSLTGLGRKAANGPTHALLTIIFIRRFTVRVKSIRTSLIPLFALTAAAAVALTGCGGGSSTDAAPSSSAVADESGAPVEQDGATPRLAMSYDGGILVLDAETLEQVADIPVDGFIRLNSADNGRHVFVSESEGFRVLDMGTWTRQHGDHGHYYTATPVMTDMRFGGAEPGHVVPHDSRITLFSDGTGQVDIVEPAELIEGNAVSDRYTVPEPHHGVAVARGDGTLVVTIGNSESRNGIAILDKQRNEITRNEQCPGIHGESAAADGVLAFGCQDGILIVRGNEIQKVASPDGYGRIGNHAADADSPIVFGDYKTDEDAELERPTRISLTDTRDGSLRIVDVPTSYSFRSLERGPDGEAVLLGTDGAIHVIDEESGREITSIPVIGEWSEPDEWQSPMPNIYVEGSIAYVSDPATRTVHSVDLDSGEKLASTELEVQGVELTGVTG